MKYLFTLSIMIIFLFSACTILTERKSDFSLTNANVIVIRSLNNNFIAGTGFYYRGYFLTANHVQTKEELYFDEHSDIKIVKRVNVKGLKRSYRYPKFGDLVVAFIPEVWAREEGQIIAKIPAFFAGRSPFNPSYLFNTEYYISVNTVRGFSGSPILNTDGELLGIATTYFPTSVDMMGRNSTSTVILFFIGIETIDNVIDEYELTLKE
ncbi:hypothetical protein LCGC14_2343490 [marine sediment metagenome]|uniref:Serine protease n=1 Tax=marine sediment metagenome TaxID=412755 RepID=A0A0F9CC36_9ZZZZ